MNANWIRTAIWMATAWSLTGCANLIVHKVPVAERENALDDEKGFRYYLPRPYIAVHQKIVIKEIRSLVIIEDPSNLHANVTTVANQGGGPQVTYLDGPFRNQTISLADLKVADANSGMFRPVTSGELQQLRGQLGSGDIRLVSHVATDDPGTAGGDPGNAGNGAAQKNSSNAIEVLYLPDLDEQYVVKNRNILAKSAFSLSFKDGVDLTHVGANHDSTTLAVEILNTIDSAIQAAHNSVDTMSKDLTGGGANQKSPTPKLSLEKNKNEVWYLVQTVSIKPGLYRLNKPWEMEGGCHVKGCGLLAQLGLPTVVDVSIEDVPAPKKATN